MTALFSLTKLFEILDSSETCLAVRNGGVHKVLFTRLVHGETFKGQVARRSKELLYIAWFKNWAWDTTLFHAVFDKVEFDGNDAGLVPNQNILDENQKYGNISTV